MTTAERFGVATIDRWLADELRYLGLARRVRTHRDEAVECAWLSIDRLLDMRNAAVRMRMP